MPVVEEKHCQIHYRMDGSPDAPVLVLSNSLGTDLSMWHPQIEEFSKAYRVLRYDTRGHGASSVTPGPYTIELLAKDVLSLLDRLAIDRVHFCGISLGGMVGIWLGAHAGQRVDKLILSNTAAILGPPEFWDRRIEAVLQGGMDAIATSLMQRWFSPRFQEQSPDVVRELRQSLVATPSDGYVACCAAIRDMDQRDVLRQIRSRTLVIAGSCDVATPPAAAHAIVESIPEAKFVELNAAHISSIEAAAEFNMAVMNFLVEKDIL